MFIANIKEEGSMANTEKGFASMPDKKVKKAAKKGGTRSKNQRP